MKNSTEYCSGDSFLYKMILSIHDNLHSDFKILLKIHFLYLHLFQIPAVKYPIKNNRPSVFQNRFPAPHPGLKSVFFFLFSIYLLSSPFFILPYLLLFSFSPSLSLSFHFFLSPTTPYFSYSAPPFAFLSFPNFCSLFFSPLFDIFPRAHHFGLKMLKVDYISLPLVKVEERIK